MHLWILCIPFYSHLKSQKSLLESFLDAWHQITIITHPRLWELVAQIWAKHHQVDRMDSFLDNPAIEQANGMAYTAAMMYETAMRIEEMVEEVKGLKVDGLIFDGATRRWKIIGLRLWLPMVSWSAMYPPLYQYNRTHTIKKQLILDMIRAPWSFIKIWQAITALIFDQKPVDYDELYTRLYNDNDIGTHTAIPACMMEEHQVLWLHTYQHHGILLEEHSEDDPERSWLRDEKRSIVYLSLGTLISVDENILKTLEKVAGSKLLFVVSTWPHGTDGRSNGVVWQSFVPQKQILDNATLCITHGGINTVIECLARKLPMLCVPFLTDQYMYSHRVEQLWVGKTENKSVLRSYRRLQEVLCEMLLSKVFTKSYEAINLYEWVEEYDNMIHWFEEQVW